jgi:crossover junction endodeoxyribonuclease RuvC
MPGQGVSGVFAFGKAYGVVIGVLAAHGVPMTFVSPVKWKKALQVPASKDGARARASQLLPQAASEWPLVKDSGRAEAALIAYWGIQQFHAIARGEAA